MRPSHRNAVTLALAACTAALVGCSSSSGPTHAGDLDAIRSNPTPAMHTLGERKTDATNRRVIVNDTNLRMFTDDLDRFLLIDRPSNLSMYPPTRR
jgi:hypothetical protein